MADALPDQPDSLTPQLASSVMRPSPVIADAADPTKSLIDLALAANRAGRPMCLLFRDYSQSVRLSYWQMAIRIVQGHVCHIRDRRDVRHAIQNVNGTRLMLVHETTLLGDLLARLCMEALDVSVTGRVPGMGVFGHCDGSLDELHPIFPTLNLCGLGWSHARGAAKPDVATEESTVASNNGVIKAAANGRSAGTSPAQTSNIVTLVQQAARAAHCPLETETVDAVVNLLLGAAQLQRHAQSSATDKDITLDNYVLVYNLLQSPVSRMATQQADPLASAMVARANVAANAAEGRRHIGPRLERVRVQQPMIINRRELADLGNTRSQAIGRLLASIAGEPTGHREELLTQIGLRQPLPTEWKWPEDGQLQAVRSMLLPWSAKQVRTRFHALVQHGLLTAERKFMNGPWVYQLPESLVPDGLSFSWLPHPGRIGCDSDQSEMAAVPAWPVVGPQERANENADSQRG